VIVVVMSRIFILGKIQKPRQKGKRHVGGGDGRIGVAHFRIGIAAAGGSDLAKDDPSHRGHATSSSRASLGCFCGRRRRTRPSKKAGRPGSTPLLSPSLAYPQSHFPTSREICRAPIFHRPSRLQSEWRTCLPLPTASVRRPACSRPGSARRRPPFSGRWPGCACYLRNAAKDR
jgi:hypothetical protein